MTLASKIGSFPYKSPIQAKLLLDRMQGNEKLAFLR